MADAVVDPPGAAARLAMDLSGLRDIECESLLVDGRSGNSDALGIFREELTSLGVVLPLSLRVSLSTSELASAVSSGVGRVVCTLSGASSASADALRGFAIEASGRGIPVEWELDCKDAEIPGWVAQLAALPVGSPPAALSLFETASVHDY
ncbi:MAG: hypothetical protein ACKVIW_08370, partial [bacterium]